MGRIAFLLAIALAVAYASAGNAQERPAKGTRYAVLVAVREYPKAKLSTLRFAENDAQQLAEVLLAAGYKEENVIRLTLSAGGQEGQARYLPTGENIRRELRVLLGGLGPQDSILVALSGHGVQFKGQKESYFCPSDADLEQTDSLLAVSDIYTQLKVSAARVKILLVDACRDDPAIAASRGPRGVELEAVGRPQEVEPPQGIAALFSCSAGQKAWEDKELRHGLFFSAVIAGLKGKADGNNDGQVTYDELSSYSINEVKRHARVKLGELQVPQQKGEFEGQIALVRIEKPGPPPPLAVAPFDAATAKKHQQAWASYLKMQPAETNSVNMKLALIPAGEFWMGSPVGELNRREDETQHRVRITKPFYLGQTEVTIGQFRGFVTDTNYTTEAERDGKGGFGYDPVTDKLVGPVSKYTWKQTGWPATDEHPVVNISWNDAVAFCDWLSRKEGRTYRLPSEAEWEFACRGGTTTAFSQSNDPEGLAQIGNICDADLTAKRFPTHEIGIKARDGFVFTAPVARFRANPFGLYDMHGNAWEWCGDWYDAAYYDALTGRTTEDPQGRMTDLRKRVLRGGSWTDEPHKARSAARSHLQPDRRYFGDGLRVVAEVRTP